MYKKTLKKQTFDYKKRDERRWEIISGLLQRHSYDAKNILSDFTAFIRRREIPRFLAHYELFKKIVDIPGSIVEIGVFKASSLMTWANLLETFCTTDRVRKVYGFDSFEGLQKLSDQDGLVSNLNGSEKFEGGYKDNGDIARTLVQLFNEDTVIPNITRVELVEGNVIDTLPMFLDEHPGMKISLLHLDADLYEVTKFTLEYLYSKISIGGIIVFDEYGLVPWEGETKAVDEFIEKSAPGSVIQKIPFSVTPGGYLSNANTDANSPDTPNRYDFRDFDPKKLQQDYLTDGCVIVDNVIEPERIIEMRQRMGIFLNKIAITEGLSTCDDDNLDILLPRALSVLKDRSAFLLGIGRDFPSFLQLISSPNIMTLMYALFETKEIQSAFDVNILRIDQPNSDKTNLDWHQDYPYNMMSQSTATVWVPILEVTKDMGPLKVVIGSNKRVLPISYHSDIKEQRFNPKYIEIADIEENRQLFETSGVEIYPIQPGTVVLLHALTVHRSGLNRSNKSRWVAVARYGDIMDKAVYRRNWFTARAKYPDVFGKYHPDLLVP